MAMEMQTVASSNIEAVGYDEDSGKLRVQFRGGRLYEYDGVEPDIYAAIIGAESPGSVFARTVRNNGNAYRQIEGEEPEDEEDEPDADEATEEQDGEADA